MSLLYICVWKYEIPVFLIFQVENRQFKNKSNRLVFYCTDLCCLFLQGSVIITDSHGLNREFKNIRN